MTIDPVDRAWMQRALRLAGRGLTPPNPMVGCVIVKDGVLVGDGFHPYAGAPHAEVFALHAAGEKAMGATAYVTLEPCCHHGRTPPCTRALIDAGIGRVLVAIQDPNPLVGGKGIELLRSAGIDVEVGLMQQQARAINSAFIHFHTHSLPYVTLKAAITLDGKIATRTGASKWITGADARKYVHKLRSQSGAVMVGIGTLLSDDPELTARLRPKQSFQPLRIVVDSQLRTPPDSRLVSTASETEPVLIACTIDAPELRAKDLARPGVTVLRVPSSNNNHARVDLNQLMTMLAERNIISVLVEGGGELNAAMLEAGIVNRAIFFVAPKIFGGRSASTAVEGEGVDQVASAISLGRLQVRRFGADVALMGDILPEGDEMATEPGSK